jgi:hypothetical protein
MQKLLKIPYNVFNDWNLLRRYLKLKGNPKYEVIGDIKLTREFMFHEFENLIKIDGNLDLYDSSVRSLGDIEEITGNLILVDTKIQSLGNLKYVGKKIMLNRNNTLPADELNKFKDQIKYVLN